MKYLIIIGFLFLSVSCEKGVINSPSNDNSGNSSIKGAWLNYENVNDTLLFINDSIFNKSHFDGIHSIFKYSIKKDSITIRYIGPNKILVSPVTNYFTLENNQLTIYLTNCAYGFDCLKKIYKKL
jgi:hypothetical protein